MEVGHSRGAVCSSRRGDVGGLIVAVVVGWGVWGAWGAADEAVAGPGPAAEKTAPRRRGPEPSSSAQRVRRAKGLVAAGKQKQAIVVCQRVRVLDQRNVACRRLLVKLFAWNQRAKEVVGVLEELSALIPGDEALWLKLAQHYTWNSKACKAIPLYQKYLTRHPGDLKRWRRLAQFGQWCNRSSLAMKGLARVVAARPDDLKATESLAKLYLWNKRPGMSVVLFRRLLAARPQRAKLRLLLAHALVATKRGREAVTQLYRYLTFKPADLKSRFLLAQLCHWSICWHRARRSYEMILAKQPGHPKALKYYTLLRRAKGHPIKVSQRVFYDTNEVLRLDTQVEGRYRLGSRWYLEGRYIHHWFSETDTLDLTGNGQNTDTLSLYSDHVVLALGFFPLYQLRTTIWAGAERFSIGRGAPRLGGEVFGSLWGKVFLKAHYRWQSHINGAVPILRGITFHEVGVSVYAEPVKWLSVSAAAKGGFFSDGNQRTLVFSGIYFHPLRKPFGIKPGFTFGYEHFTTQYATSDPYYTPDHIMVFSPGLDVSYHLRRTLSVEAGYSLAIMRDGKLAHNPRFRLKWWFLRFAQLELYYYRSGSSVYGYHLGGASLRTLF